jgi:hypothetical protein
LERLEVEAGADVLPEVDKNVIVWPLVFVRFANSEPRQIQLSEPVRIQRVEPLARFLWTPDVGRKGESQKANFLKWEFAEKLSCIFAQGERGSEL